MYKMIMFNMILLTHWGWVIHICIGKLTIIGSDNGLSPERRQAIIWTNARILLIGPLGTNFREILIKIITFSFKKMCLKVSSAKWCPFCLGLNVLIKISSDFTSNMCWAPLTAGLRAGWWLHPGLITWDCMLDCVGCVKVCLDGRLSQILYWGVVQYCVAQNLYRTSEF